MSRGPINRFTLTKEMDMTRIIDRPALQARIAANPRLLLLEALPEEYYAQGHLPGALNFPHDRVAELAPHVAARLDAEIVVYCANRSCQNSHIAAAELARRGYTDVSVYAQGKQDWIEAGLPVQAAVAA
jgi:rhodanese-related sulfurtransferase